MTDPEPNLESQENEGPTHIEVEPPAAAQEPPPPAAPVAGPPPPRAFPQHYKLLFGAFCVLIGSMAVWEREHVFGMEIEGEVMISGTILTVLAGYSVIVGILNIMQGRLAGMLAAFMTGVMALYFGIPAMIGTFNHDRFIALNEITEFREQQAIPKRFTDKGLEFPGEVFEKFTTQQDAWKYVIGQYAPGPIMTTFGGLLMIWVFLGAMFGGKKKKAEPEPAPSSRRRGRR
ncbi:MAG: hypothetical protein ACYTHK_02680 [Planctomycetota bacterium]|jgi:hypothetical protein